MEKTAFKKYRITYMVKHIREFDSPNLTSAALRAEQLVALVSEGKLLSVEEVKPFVIEPPQFPPPPWDPPPVRPA